MINLEQGTLAVIQGTLSQVYSSTKDELVTALLGQMASRVRELEDERTRFLRTAAHELRNPMTGVKGTLSLLRMRLASGKKLNQIAQILQAMEVEVDRLSLVLDGILEAFQLREGLLLLRRKKTNLAKLVNSALEPFLGIEQGQRLLISGTTGDPVYILGDPDYLLRVMRYLFSNALRYSSAGTKVRVKLQVADAKAILSVKSSGLGVPVENLVRILEDSAWTCDVSTPHPGGLGLGLFVSKDIIQRHEGQLRVESNRGEGTTFFLEIPLHRSPGKPPLRMTSR